MLNVCTCCLGNDFINKYVYTLPDKYEQYCGLVDIDRSWAKCFHCGHWQSFRNYDVSKLLKVYIDGYRDQKFRGEDIQESFDKIMSMPKSENSERVKWLVPKIFGANGKLLDIGSGLGVFPYAMKKEGFKVWCTELNKDSFKFINDTLRIPCTSGNLHSDYDKTFSVVSFVHVLEHFEKPVMVLGNHRRYMQDRCKVFIEVPDACEFDYLPPEHDEFNSCHVNFFTVSSLSRIVENAGFKVLEISSKHYYSRNLSRILMLAEKCN